MHLVSIVVSCLVISPVWSRHRKCFECTWDAYHEVDDRRREQKRLEREELEKKSVHLSWIPQTEKYFGKEITSTYPTLEHLRQKELCGICDLGPNTVCVKWQFFPHTKDQPMNVTWGCVASSERGCFEEKAANDLYKEVCLCDEYDLCNATTKCMAGSLLLLLPLVTFVGQHLYNLA